MKKEIYNLDAIGTLKLTERNSNKIILKKNLILKFSPHILALGLSGNIIKSTLRLQLGEITIRKVLLEVTMV